MNEAIFSRQVCLNWNTANEKRSYIELVFIYAVLGHYEVGHSTKVSRSVNIRQTSPSQRDSNGVHRYRLTDGSLASSQCDHLADMSPGTYEFLVR